MIPKAADAEHLAGNVAAEGRALEAEDIATINALRRQARIGLDPREM